MYSSRLPVKSWTFPGASAFKTLHDGKAKTNLSGMVIYEKRNLEEKSKGWKGVQKKVYSKDS